MTMTNEVNKAQIETNAKANLEAQAVINQNLLILLHSFEQSAIRCRRKRTHVVCRASSVESNLRARKKTEPNK